VQGVRKENVGMNLGSGENSRRGRSGPSKGDSRRHKKGQAKGKKRENRKKITSNGGGMFLGPCKGKGIRTQRGKKAEDWISRKGRKAPRSKVVKEEQTQSGSAKPT